MNPMMTVVYASYTQHVLAALRRVTPADDGLEGLIGPDGLSVAGGRMAVAIVAGFNYGVEASGSERLVVPKGELSSTSLHFDLDVLRRPFRYVSDGTSAAALPLSNRVRITLSTTAVTIGSPKMLPNPGHLTFVQDTKVLIAVEGPTPADRRVMRGVFHQGNIAEQHFVLTTDAGMQLPLAAANPTRPYSILVLIEGQSPDLRTAHV